MRRKDKLSSVILGELMDRLINDCVESYNKGNEEKGDEFISIVNTIDRVRIPPLVKCITIFADNISTVNIFLSKISECLKQYPDIFCKIKHIKI